MTVTPSPIRFCGTCGLARDDDERHFCGRCGASYAEDAVASESALPDPTRQRSPVIVALLTALTFGLYFPVWLGLSWNDLRRAVKDPRMRSPAAHALLSLVPLFGLRRVATHFSALASLRAAAGLPPARLGRKFALLVAVSAGLLQVAANLSTTIASSNGGFITRRMLDDLTSSTAVVGAAALLAVVAILGQRLLNDYLRTRPVPLPRRQVRPAEWTAVAAGLLLTVASFSPASAGTSATTGARTISVSSFVDEASLGAPLTRRLTTTEIAEIGRQATVFIRQGQASGSGVYLGADLVLTARHVVDGTDAIAISFANKRVGEAAIVKSEGASDLALLRLSGLSTAGARPATWGNSQQLRLGDPLVVIGYPLGLGLTVSSGIVSALKGQSGVHLVQTDAAVNPGNSGGPVFNAAAELVGIADFTFRGTQGLNFAVASRTARTFADGTVFTPAPAAASATATPRPTAAAIAAASAKFAVPAKGAPLFEAKLDGTRADIRLPLLAIASPPPDSSDVRFLTGSIELAVKPGGGTGFVLNVGALDTYVAEFEIAVAPGTKFGTSWIAMRRALNASGGQSYPAVAVRINMADETVEGVYQATSSSTVSLSSRVAVSGLQTGRTFTLAYVAESGRYTLFLDQKQVGLFDETRVSGQTFPDVFYSIGPSSGGGGTLRVLAARLYRLPS